MEQSAFDALIFGTFVIVFIIAISTTIFLFREIVDYSDKVFDAANKFSGDSILVLEGVNSVNTTNIIRGVEALAYVTNYGCYETNGSTYRYSAKYADNFDSKVKVRLKATNGALTTNVNLAGYYRVEVYRLENDSTVIVDLNQYTKAEVDAM